MDYINVAETLPEDGYRILAQSVLLFESGIEVKEWVDGGKNNF